MRRAASMCAACGACMPIEWGTGYARCNACIDSDRPHSLAIVRQVRASRQRARYGLDDYDPAGNALAA